MNYLILKGIMIGQDSILGASSVAANDVATNVIVAGNPAKIIRDMR
jgi:maltose O-acetyltransferase